MALRRVSSGTGMRFSAIVAHVRALFAQESSMADLSGQASGRGFNSPLRFEASVDDCEVVGKIPEDLNGAFYRVGAEWYYPPRFPDDAILNADGYVSMF